MCICSKIIKKKMKFVYAQMGLWGGCLKMELPTPKSWAC